jgi:dihydroneopterin aldolase
VIRQLDIADYEMYVIIGDHASERYEKRKIVIDVSFRFTKDNSACKSDNISETVCYSDLVDFMEKKLQNTEFRLVERAAQFLYDEISAYLNDVSILKYIKVTKVAPPVKNVKNVSFICSDW